jgi:hypothetical protein
MIALVALVALVSPHAPLGLGDDVALVQAGRGAPLDGHTAPVTGGRCA